MIVIGAYGWRIKIYKAATVVGVMLGVRDNYDSIEAMFHHSLFSDWLHENGMKTDKKDESTRDIICMDYQFGLRSYEEEKAHIKDLRKKAQKIEDEEERNERIRVLDELEEKIDSRKDKYRRMTKDEIREYTYVNGIHIDYPKFDKDKNIVGYDRIYYKRLYRNPSMAKTGKCIFINADLYDKAYEHISMGLGPRLPEHNAKIVEFSAYIPLLASSIEGTVHIPIEDVLIIKDQDSFFKTIADVIRTEDYQVHEQVKGKKSPQLVTKKKCVVHREETEVKNTLWDGMALIETSIMPEWCNGMALLRMHFFKACAFRTKIQDFLRDYCAEHGIDYETYEIEDMFGHKHLARNIKLVTTNNATKFLKMRDLMGGTDKFAYEYWCEWVRKDGNLWGIVKTDHQSKLDNYQQLSYQAVNSLPTTKEEMMKITETSMNYVSDLKNNDKVFIDYLKKNANYINSNEMLVELYEQNHEIMKSSMFKKQKKFTINEYVTRLKKGKVIQIGDNMTVCGNPYALLLYMVGEDWNNDPTLLQEEGTIQVYCLRFEDGEFLCGIRSPHNSSNNLGYFHNIKHPLMEKYFDFSNNIMAVNCIHTDIMCRMNGMDWIA